MVARSNVWTYILLPPYECCFMGELEHPLAAFFRPTRTTQIEERHETETETSQIEESKK